MFEGSRVVRDKAEQRFLPCRESCLGNDLNSVTRLTAS